MDTYKIQRKLKCCANCRNAVRDHFVLNCEWHEEDVRSVGICDDFKYWSKAWESDK